MKNIIKNFFLAVTLFLGVGLLQGCSNDVEYSLDKFAVGIATVVNQPGTSWYLELDSGEKLWIAAGVPNYRPLDGQRVIIDYTPLSGESNGFDHMIRLNRIWDIKTKSLDVVTDEASLIEFGEDRCPIVIGGFPNGIWISGDQSYLNVVVAIYSRQALVSLVDNQLEEYPDDGYKHLELKYNAFGTELDYSVAQTYSFVLKDLETAGIKGFKVKRIDAEGREDEITLDFNKKSDTYSQAYTSDINVSDERLQKAYK